jgi:hypothetical protein
MAIKVVVKIMDVCAVHSFCQLTAELLVSVPWKWFECVCCCGNHSHQLCILHVSAICHQLWHIDDSIWKYELTQYANSCTYMICMWERPDVRCIALDCFLFFLCDSSQCSPHSNMVSSTWRHICAYKQFQMLAQPETWKCTGQNVYILLSTV